MALEREVADMGHVRLWLLPLHLYLVYISLCGLDTPAAWYLYRAPATRTPPLLSHTRSDDVGNSMSYGLGRISVEALLENFQRQEVTAGIARGNIISSLSGATPCIITEP